jgi:hypothetical protein
MAATVLAIRTARPALSAMSSQSFETSTPMHNGPATPIVTRGEPGLPFALKTEKGRTTDRDCLRTRVPSRIDLAVLPAILTADAMPQKNSRSTRTIQGAGYHGICRGERRWNGVAILARWAPVVTRMDLPGDDSDRQCRYLEAAVNGVLVASIYAPNGNPNPVPNSITNWLG